MALRLLFIITFSFLINYGYASIPPGYYDTADGLEGDALKSALNDIIDGHTELSYDDVKNALRETDEDPGNTNNVVCLYTGWSYGKYDFGNGQTDWNREHVWSKSHGDFGNDPPAGTDIHHLRPTDASVNSSKNNRDFDEGTILHYDNGVLTGCKTDSYIWEPRDSEKGDVARMIFYMATRYEGENGEVDLEIIESVNTAPNNNEPFYGNLATLLIWHQNDPVDNWEIIRNNIIYDNYQGNRNPYIDHPEYVALIWGTTNPEPSNHVISFTTSSTTSSSILLTWDDNDGADVADKFLLMINTTGSFTAPVDGAENNDDTDISDGAGQVNVSHGNENYTFLGLDASTLYYFEIYPFANFGTDIDYKTDGSIPNVSTSTTEVGASNLTLIISEVADPNDVHQARFVELYNAGSEVIDFSSETWYLCRQANGDGWGNKLLTGSLAASDTYVVATNLDNFNTYYGFYPNLSSGYISGNGDDGYFLFFGGDNTSGVLIDAYGVIDEDGTDKEWEYENSKAVRKHNSTTPSQTWQAEQWVITSSQNAEDMTPNWHRITLGCTGTSPIAWEDVNNWTAGGSASSYLPDAGSEVVIPTSQIVIITTDALCGKLTLETNSELHINQGSLFVWE